MSEFEKLNQRSREVFQKVVESYLNSGEPIGSRNLSESLSEKISSATVRNVLAELEDRGLIGSPHISSGRLPTELGLRFFVDGILEVKSLPLTEQRKIQSAINRNANEAAPVNNVFERTGSMLSEISHTASLVFTKKQDHRLKHMDFVWLSQEQALVILVDETGQVDNRLFTPPMGMTSSDLERAANFINSHIQGRTLSELQRVLEDAIRQQKQDVDQKMAHLIEIGHVSLMESRGTSQLLVRGRSNLLSNQKDLESLESLRLLMDDLESKRDLVELLELSDGADAVRVFIGSENKLFSLKSSSLVVSPYMNGEGEIIGAVGVIGPTRLNYAKIVPMVSYTANLIGKYIENNEDEYDRG